MDESKAVIDNFITEYVVEGKKKQEMITKQLPLAIANLAANEKA